jgi:hypothetical protein
MLALLFRSLVFFFVVVSAQRPDEESIVAPETEIVFSKGGWGETKFCFQVDAAVFPGFPTGSKALTVMVNLGMKIESKGEVTVDLTIGSALSSKWLGSVFLELVLSATFTNDNVKELTAKKVATGLIRKVLVNPFTRWTKKPPGFGKESAKRIKENIIEIFNRQQPEGQQPEGVKPSELEVGAEPSDSPPTRTKHARQPLNEYYEQLFADELLKDEFVEALMTKSADFVKRGVAANGDEEKLLAIYKEWLGGDSQERAALGVCDFPIRNQVLVAGHVAPAYLCSFLLGGYFLENPEKQAKALKKIKRLTDKERKAKEEGKENMFLRDMFPQDSDDSIAKETIKSLFPLLLDSEFCNLYTEALAGTEPEEETKALLAHMEFPKKLMMIAMPLEKIISFQEDIEKELKDIKKKADWLTFTKASMQLHLGVTAGIWRGLYRKVANYGCTPDTNVFQAAAGYQWMFNKEGKFERGSSVGWVIAQDPSARFQFQLSYCGKCNDGKRNIEFAFELRIPDTDDKKEAWGKADWERDYSELAKAIEDTYEKVKAEVSKLVEKSGVRRFLTWAGGLLTQAGRFLSKKGLPKPKSGEADPSSEFTGVVPKSALLEASSQTGVKAVGKASMARAKEIFAEMIKSHEKTVEILSKLGMCQALKKTAKQSFTVKMLTEAGKIAAATEFSPIEFTDNSRLIISLKTSNNGNSRTIGLSKDRQNGVKVSVPEFASVHAYFWRGAGIEITRERQAKAAFVTIMEKGRTRPESLQP